MPFIISAFDSMTLKSILRVSNYWGKANRNQYPLAFSKALDDLYDWVPCKCDNHCSCKQFACTHHYIRKPDIPFDLAETHFISCYIDKNKHNEVLRGEAKGRCEKAPDAISTFESMYDKLPALETHLLCTNWCNKEFQEYAKSFKVNSSTIYKAKWLSLLQLDTFVAYDTASFRLLLREYRGLTYYDLMSSIRSDLINHMIKYSISILSFREYDNPQEFHHTIPMGQYRPIGNIIDKLFLTL